MFQKFLVSEGEVYVAFLWSATEFEGSSVSRLPDEAVCLAVPS